MKKFAIKFKDPAKKYQIDSQDDKTAKEWAEKQLEVWKTKTEYTITEVK